MPPISNISWNMSFNIYLLPLTVSFLRKGKQIKIFSISPFIAHAMLPKFKTFFKQSNFSLKLSFLPEIMRLFSLRTPFILHFLSYSITPKKSSLVCRKMVSGESLPSLLGSAGPLYCFQKQYKVKTYTYWGTHGIIMKTLQGVLIRWTPYTRVFVWEFYAISLFGFS